ncbi:dihydrolipoamide acetyltransferase family protein [Streptomyces sp. NPDC048473]|uniref:dihydrolipoamide acetyltransferase family protein n=1 Tax=unclassified Streptomyces TaxID=2593676 RepID=UPI003714C208
MPATDTPTEPLGTVREFRLPDVGEGLADAQILTWYVKPGDTVSDGQTVCEVETAKAAVELPIPFDGLVEEVFCAEGDTVDVGTPIISVAVTREKESGAGAEPERREVLVGYGPRVDAARPRSRSRRTPVPATPVPPAPAPAAPAPVGVRPLAKPPVRKLAKDLGVDLRTVTPSGPDGVISREDVRAAAVPAAVAPEVPGERRVPVQGVRRATARAVVASAFTAPHVTEFLQVDVTRMMKLVRKLKASGELGEVRVGPLLLVAKALLVAVARNPEINASWDEAAQEIVYKEHVNLGIAAATPRGLIVPHIKNAGTRSLADLAAAIASLTAAARAGTTTPADLRGGTLTLTNIGVFGVDAGTPILNPGEAAILAFGAVRELPWVHKGKVVPRQVTTLALSFDHRLVDGELGSKVLADTAAVLERPRRLITWG